MISNVKVSVMYKGNDNQWRIDFVHDDEERSFENIREIELISMYHCLAKELTEKFDYNLTYSDSEISRCYNVETYGKSGSYPRNKRFTLRKDWVGYELLHFYDYENLPNSCTTYGNFDIDDLVALVRGIGDFVLNNDVHRLTYENLKEDWLQNRNLGIIFTPYDAHRHFFDADEDFSPQAFAKARKASCHRIWESHSKNAITLWNQPYEEVKLEVTKNYVKFYRRDDIFSSYTYPPLHELKKDKDFFNALLSLWQESYPIEDVNKFVEDFEVWSKNDCDFPPFPIEQIFASDYQNYKFYEVD